jgi:hypothetical protein
VCEGLDDDRALQPQRDPQSVVLSDPATDGQGQQAMVLPKCVDRLGTGRAVLGLDFIEPIQQRQYLVCIDPRLANCAGHVVPLLEFVDQPDGQGAPPRGSGG